MINKLSVDEIIILRDLVENKFIGSYNKASLSYFASKYRDKLTKRRILEILQKYAKDEYIKCDFQENDLICSIPDTNKYEQIKEMIGIKDEEEVARKQENKKLNAFISYSTNDKLIGRKIKDILDRFNIEGFLAHDDIHVSEEWKQRIVDELNKADIFISLLSEHFKKSEWTSQELGIAYFRNILIIPLKLDDTNPFGFINHIQGKSVNSDNILLSYLIKPILDRFHEYMIATVIGKLSKAGSFRYAESIMELLVPHFNEFQKENTEKFVDASIENGQVWSADKCRKEYLPKFIDIHKHSINPDKLKILNYQIEKGEYYKETKNKENKILFYSPQAIDSKIDSINIDYVNNEETLLGNLNKYDIVILLLFEIKRGFTIEQQNKIIDYIRTGGKVIGFHDALYGYYNLLLSQDLFGVMQVRTLRRSNIEIHIAKNKGEHPICQNISQFSVIDEETFDVTLPDNSEILFVDKENLPVGWYRKYINGDIFCFKLGHDKNIIENENVKKILINTIKWFSLKDN